MENSNDPRNIDEVSFESHISNIANIDVITSGDLKGLKSVAPRTFLPERPRGLIDTFDGHRKGLFFHQAGDAFIPNGVSFGYQQLRDTSIPVCRIRCR